MRVWGGREERRVEWGEAWGLGWGRGREERRRTKESEMIVLRPAVILKVVEGSLAGDGAAKMVLLLGARLD